MEKLIELYFKLWFSVFPMERRIIVCTHHKTGTVLMRHFCETVSRISRISFLNSERDHIPADGPVIVLAKHSNLSTKELEDFTHGVHLSRNPRELLISSYLYHLRSNEDWLHRDLKQLANWPRRAAYRQFSLQFESLSYQMQCSPGGTYAEQLKSLPKEMGILRELYGSAGWNILDMISFPVLKNVPTHELDAILNDPDILTALVFEPFTLNARIFKILVTRILRTPQGKSTHVADGAYNPSKWKLHETEKLNNEVDQFLTRVVLPLANNLRTER